LGAPHDLNRKVARKLKQLILVDVHRLMSTTRSKEALSVATLSCNVI
jgi:hypothetical protein